MARHATALGPEAQERILEMEMKLLKAAARARKASPLAFASLGRGQAENAMARHVARITLKNIRRLFIHHSLASEPDSQRSGSQLS